MATAGRLRLPAQSIPLPAALLRGLQRWPVASPASTTRHTQAQPMVTGPGMFLCDTQPPPADPALGTRHRSSTRQEPASEALEGRAAVGDCSQSCWEGR